MNNRGFTLIELIVTIALLAIISVISFVSISKAIEQGRKNDCISLVENIKSATNEYVSDNRYNKEFTSQVTSTMDGENEYRLTAATLINGNYLKGPIKDPYNNDEIEPGSIEILVTLKPNYTVRKVEILGPDVLKECK